jgi:large subunit ribosomal protein L19
MNRGALLKVVETKYTRTDLPQFKPGDTVKVNYKVVEGTRSRVQAYEGVVLKIKNNGFNSSFTVRKISFGEGVERIFPYNSPLIDSVDVLGRGKVRRAKLYYLRELRGKSARIRSDRKRTSEDSDARAVAKVEAEKAAAEKARLAAEAAAAAKVAAEAEAAAKAAAEAEARAAAEAEAKAKAEAEAAAKIEAEAAAKAAAQAEANAAQAASAAPVDRAVSSVAGVAQLASADDIEVIEGIGPKIGAALREAGISTFAGLVAASQDQLKEALTRAEIRIPASIGTWGKQAQYLVDGDQEGFKKYTDELIAGRESGQD